MVLHAKTSVCTNDGHARQIFTTRQRSRTGQPLARRVLSYSHVQKVLSNKECTADGGLASHGKDDLLPRRIDAVCKLTCSKFSLKGVS